MAALELPHCRCRYSLRRLVLLEAAVEHAAALRVELSGLLLVEWMRKEEMRPTTGAVPSA